MEPMTISKNRARLKKACFHLLTAGVIFFAFSACDNTKSELRVEIPPSKHDTKGVTLRSLSEESYAVRYIRTFGHVDYSVKYPIVTQNSSKEEFEGFYQSYIIGDESREGISYSSSEFEEAIAHYSEAFFANNFLVVVLLVENSGSIRHEVESIDEKGGILINRLLP